MEDFKMFQIKNKKDVNEFINNFSGKYAFDVWGEGWDAFFYSTYNGNNVLIEKEDGFYDFWYNQNSYDREPSKIDDVAEYVWGNRKFINEVFRQQEKEYERRKKEVHNAFKRIGKKAL
jgi:hypothetical protein